MCEALTWSINAMSSTNWLEVVKTLAPVATAIIALVALKNWQRQDKAKREAEFLDSLIEATHTYIAQMPAPITLLEIAEIGMRSYAPTWEEGDQAVKGAIAYIEAKGEQDAKRLREALDTVQPAVIRLRSLTAKGQIFKFKGYAKCHDAVAMLTWQFDRVEAFMTVIRSSTWNWENPEVLQHLKNVIAISPDDIRKSIQTNNVSILEFAREAYGDIYG